MREACVTAVRAAIDHGELLSQNWKQEVVKKITRTAAIMLFLEEVCFYH